VPQNLLVIEEETLLFWAYILWSIFWGRGLTRVVTYEGGLWRTPFTFDHGYVLVWDDPVDDTLAHADTIALYARDGHKLYATSLTGPDGEAWAVSGAIDTDGTVAAVYFDRANAQERGVALIDSSGKIANFIKPDPYYPGHLCFTEDGTIWITGSWTPTVPSQSVTADFLTVRRYSRSGGLMGAFLPLSGISSVEDALIRRPFDQQIGGWLVRASKDHVGMKADVQPVKQWVEIDFAGNLAGRWDYGDVGDLKIRAFTSSGAVYGQRFNDRERPELMVLDKSSGKWKWAGVTVNGELLAADGNDLVFRMDNTAENILVWVRVRGPQPSLEQ
jgi:hypothetical protein